MKKYKKKEKVKKKKIEKLYGKTPQQSTVF